MITADYRPEIDGLRTIAVLAVLVYHAELFIGGQQLLVGGFLGVDVFFVISGFLITSLIRSEYLRTGQFSFSNFYERRARRLLPALLTVMIAALPLAWVLLLPSQLIDFSNSLVSSLAFGSNFYWHFTLQQYGEESALVKPFLHTWSLAVEEQYYIVFPLMLLALYRWCNRWAVVLLVVSLVVSLLFAQWLTPRDQSTSFYLLPSRFWELLAGAVLAHMINRRPSDLGIAGAIMPLLGLAFIAYALCYIRFDAGHPGFITAVPVVGTCLIIWFANARDIVTRVLSSKLFVGVGLISYSLYLWHYPIFAFGRIHDANPALLTKVGWIGASFLLSITAYFVVEKPYRNRSRVDLKLLIFTMLGASALVVTFCLIVFQYDGLKHRFPSQLEIYGKNEFDNAVLRRQSWDGMNELAAKQGYEPALPKRPSSFEKNVRWFSSNTDSDKVLVIGNSHSKDLFNAFYQSGKLFQNKEFARFGMSKEVPDSHVDALLKSENFRAANKVVISFFYTKKTVAELPSLINSIQKSGKSVYLVSHFSGFRAVEDKPVFDWFVQHQPAGKTLSNSEINTEFFKRRHSKSAETTNEKIEALAKTFGTPYLEKYDLICDDSRRICEGITPDGYKSFYDSIHWTIEGARRFGARMHELKWLD
ncbi:MAG: peptidoglycan/LPS O-acetylase OafA/YrhL [Halieaceae bacterium]